MSKVLTLFHGSQTIVGRPDPELGGRRKDFGPGFYCTMSADLAGEWACGSGTAGYINRYSLDTKGLKILDLGKAEFGKMEWLALMASHRTFMTQTDMPRIAAHFLSMHYSVRESDYDIIRGPRGDDSYFSFASDFIANTVSFGRFASAMDIGREGEQVAVISEKAMNRMRYEGSEPADPEVHFRARCERDIRARTEYLRRGKREEIDTYDIMMEDLVLGRVAPYDSRLQ